MYKARSYRSKKALRATISPCDGGNRPYFRPNANATRGQIAKIVYTAIIGGATCAPLK